MIETLNGVHETVNYRGDFRILIHKNKENEDFPEHWHTDIEIIMPVENTYKVIIDEVTYKLNEKDIIVIPSGTLHQLCAPCDGHRIIVQFDYSVLDNLSDINKVLQMLYPCVNVTQETMPNIQDELSAFILDITDEYFSNRPLRNATIYSKLTCFLTTLARECIERDEIFKGARDQKHQEYIDMLMNVCKYIDEHYAESIKMDDIANIAGFSKFHFARLFKQVMDVSWYDYLINRRVMQAEKLLLETDSSIMQIAMKSGFGSLATFNRTFKQRKGRTPTEYKRNYKRIQA